MRAEAAEAVNTSPEAHLISVLLSSTLPTLLPRQCRNFAPIIDKDCLQRGQGHVQFPHASPPLRLPGSLALLGCSHVQSTIAKKLAKRGAIILAKAGMSEWANYRGLSVSGWSGRIGQVAVSQMPPLCFCFCTLVPLFLSFFCFIVAMLGTGLVQSLVWKESHACASDEKAMPNIYKKRACTQNSVPLCFVHKAN